MRHVIQTDGLSKYYGEVKALHNLSIDVKPGAVGLLGPNGAGKSTLIKVLLGLTPPTSGTGKVLELDSKVDGMKIRQRIGYMPEHDCFLPDLNAVSYLTYLGQLSGLRAYDAMQRAHEALFYVRIGDERYRELATYSTGMRQKVKLAQALVHDPELILLDEPTSGLDPHGRREMLDLIKNIVQQQGKNILFSSHILTDIEHICDHVIILNHGELVKTGKLKELLFDAEPDLVVRIRGDQEKFMGLLKDNGLQAVERKNDILVKYKPDVAKRVIEITADAGVQLRHLNRSKHTLEELFIDFIDQNEQEGRK
jgi:ABC-2 type transport system ATP-binding protein